uniref:Purple acid phosphatase n=1 Tax=Pristhesancus plagipennis TaxID=1955184 RepID=A0A2K8JV35_PRIPG|nr:secreted Phosphatase protein [Pristhesancus plagipennis]
MRLIIFISAVLPCLHHFVYGDNGENSMNELYSMALKQTIMQYQPEQVHISLGENLDEIVVTWSTFSPTAHSIVEFGINGLVETVYGYSKPFIDNGQKKRKQYIHRVVLTDLLPKTKYEYHCGSKYGWSDLFWFITVDNTTKWAPKLAVYGDLGNINAVSLPYLQQEVQRNYYDAIVHAGDFAYDMATDNGEVGDEFMRQIQPIAAYVPYMVCPGNHEEAYNFSHYKERFTMPGPYENLFYSFNLGPIHFISINTEVYYFLEYGIKLAIKQYVWLEKDLEEANKPENRARRPWIITYGHRPMYCSDDDGDDCTKHSSRVRVGFPIFDWFGLEQLFYDHGVDLEIWAHEHSYERLWPVYDHIVKNGSFNEPYVNPRAPVHVITGSAGCQELVDPFIKNPQPWSAFRSSDYGYARLQAFNSSHLYMEQVSIDLNGDVIDSFWIVKDKHGPYGNELL